MKKILLLSLVFKAYSCNSQINNLFKKNFEDAKYTARVFSITCTKTIILFSSSLSDIEYQNIENILLSKRNFFDLEIDENQSKLSISHLTSTNEKIIESTLNILQKEYRIESQEEFTIY